MSTPDAATSKFSCFVTGTDTEIGKTLISSTLLYALAQAGVRAAGMKPVAAGMQWLEGAWHNEDVDRLAHVAALELPLTLTSPYLFREPIAPHIAAHNEGVTMRVQHIVDCYAAVVAQAEAVVVEGVGGFCVPLSEDADTADLAGHLALPVVLVVGMRLGCISHSLLTARAIKAQGLRLAGWVANTVEVGMPYQAENIETLRTRLDAPLLGVVPRLDDPSAQAVASHLDFSLLPAWPKA